MQRNTEPKNILTKSIGAGIGAILHGKSDYFVLEHKGGSKSWRPGQTKEVIVNYIEFGRSSQCGIRFSEEDQYVSRRHAAIRKENGNWVLINLSTTNQTLLNGHAVDRQWYLKSGDQIQLSAHGPVFSFLIPAQNKASTIGLTRRLSLFRQQALRPYKNTLIVLSVLLVFMLVGGGVLLYNQSQKTNLLETKNKKLELQNQKLAEILHGYVNRQQIQEEQFTKEINANKAKSTATINSLMSRLENVEKEWTHIPQKISEPSLKTDSIKRNELMSLFKNVAYVEVNGIQLTTPDGKQVKYDRGWSGTGFLTHDGYFITARHVVEPWYFSDTADIDFFTISILDASYKIKIEGELDATFPDGKKLVLNLNRFQIDRSADVYEKILSEDVVYYFRSAITSPYDLAYVKTDYHDGLLVDKSLSENLSVQTDLFVIGYPLGLGSSDRSKLNPFVGKTVVSMNGLEQGCIITSPRNFDHGNSGGPVVILEKDKYYVVGVVSATLGPVIGRIIPISYLKNN
jgi:S1-C subfamily serine protease